MQSGQDYEIRIIDKRNVLAYLPPPLSRALLAFSFSYQEVGCANVVSSTCAFHSSQPGFLLLRVVCTLPPGAPLTLSEVLADTLDLCLITPRLAPSPLWCKNYIEGKRIIIKNYHPIIQYHIGLIFPSFFSFSLFSTTFFSFYFFLLCMTPFSNCKYKYK